MEFVLFGRLLGACVVVALVLYVLQVAGRRALRTAVRRAPGGRIVAVLETTALPDAASLHVVRVAERYLVLGRGGGQVTLLCEIPGDAFPGPLARDQTCAANAGGAGASLRHVLARLRFPRT